MSSLSYGNYTLISRPHYDKELRAWLPYASIFHEGKPFHYHQLIKFDCTFQKESEAMTFGFTVASKWIDRLRSGEKCSLCEPQPSNGSVPVGVIDTTSQTATAERRDTASRVE